MLHLVSGTNSRHLFVNPILVPVTLFPTHTGEFTHHFTHSTTTSPLCSSITLKPFWNDELNRLKEENIFGTIYGYRLVDRLLALYS